MHACVSWTKAQGLTAALGSFLSLGSSVLCWSALGRQWLASFSHLRTHLSQQFSVSCASTHPSSTGSRGCACSSSLPTSHMCFISNTHSYRSRAWQAFCWDAHHGKSVSALQQSPFIGAGESVFAWVTPSVSRQVLVFARWVRRAPNYTGC